MEKVYNKCCGIDVHKKLIVACFREDNQRENREFGATTREILESWSISLMTGKLIQQNTTFFITRKSLPII